MTHDALVRFAAGKLKIPLREWNGRQVYSNTIARESGWIVLDDGNYTTFDITSPELFLKGLEVLPDYISWDIDGDKSEQYVNLVDLRKGDTNAARFWKTPKEIPLLFWQCWAELEGGQG